jgi:hypothetical protein
MAVWLALAGRVEARKEKEREGSARFGSLVCKISWKDSQTRLPPICAHVYLTGISWQPNNGGSLARQRKGEGR